MIRLFLLFLSLQTLESNLDGVSPKFPGPNCWNLALVSAGILPALRYSPPEEMAFYAESSLCRPLRIDERRQEGDIGAIAEWVGDVPVQIHAFVHLSDRTAFSKNGIGSDIPFAMQPLDPILKLYGVPEDDECQGNELPRSAICPRATFYIRCESLPRFIGEHPNLPAPLVNLVARLSEVEKDFQERALYGTPLSDVARQRTLVVVEDLVKYLAAPKLSGLTAAERFLIDLIDLRLGAMVQQLIYSEDIFLSVELKRLHLEFKGAASAARN